MPNQPIRPSIPIPCETAVGMLTIPASLFARLGNIEAVEDRPERNVTLQKHQRVGPTGQLPAVFERVVAQSFVMRGSEVFTLFARTGGERGIVPENDSRG